MDPSLHLEPSGEGCTSVFSLYRQIQLLNSLNNQLFQDAFFPTAMSAAAAVLTVSLFVCIKLHEKIPMPGFAFFPQIGVNCTLVFLIFKVCAAVLNQSKKFLGVMGNSSIVTSSKLFKRVVSSLNETKVKFGSNNFFENQTPFNCIDICLSNTVNLIILTST